MSVETVRAGFDTWAGSGKPALEHPREKALKIDSSTAYAFLWLKSPAPRGATVTRATLTLRAKGASSGSRTISVHRIAAGWKEGRLNWNNKPGVAGTAATASIGGLSDGSAIEIDVTSIVQAWTNGTANYGFRISTSATAAHLLYAMNSRHKPTLRVEWSDAPSKPTNLRPSEAATSVAKPHVLFDYKDVSGNTTLAAVQVQIATNSAMTTGLWDSGEVATASSGLALAQTSYPGLGSGATVYWRIRAKDGAGLWSVWSDVVSMTRTAKPTVTITNLGAGVFYEPTPMILWDVTGGTQTRYRVLVFDTANLARPVHDSQERAGAEGAYTISSGLTDGRTYRVVVQVWDAVTREATPGDHTYAQAQADCILDTDSGVGTVASLTATQVGESPWVDLTWTRSTTPDSYVLIRDGKVVSTLDPADVFVSGSTYALRDYAARPNHPHTYAVRAVVNGRQSTNGPTAAITTTPSGIWVADVDRGISFTLWGDDEGSWGVQDDASVYTPVGSSKVVRIVSAMRGLEGNLSGLLMEGFGKTFAQMEADAYRIKEDPAGTVRIVAGDENFEALIGNLRISPKPVTRKGQIVRGVSFDFWQVGDLRFTPL